MILLGVQDSRIGRLSTIQEPSMKAARRRCAKARLHPSPAAAPSSGGQVCLEALARALQNAGDLRRGAASHSQPRWSHVMYSVEVRRWTARSDCAMLGRDPKLGLAQQSPAGLLLLLRSPLLKAKYRLLHIIKSICMACTKTMDLTTPTHTPGQPPLQQ